jgi:hypothetical protein
MSVAHDVVDRKVILEMALQFNALLGWPSSNLSLRDLDHLKHTRRMSPTIGKSLMQSGQNKRPTLESRYGNLKVKH